MFDGRLQMHVSVRDNGIGMSEEFQKTLFLTRFPRKDEAKAFFITAQARHGHYQTAGRAHGRKHPRGKPGRKGLRFFSLILHLIQYRLKLWTLPSWHGR